MFFSPYLYSPAKLEPDKLSLEPGDFQVANIIAAETESARAEKLRRALAEWTPDQLRQKGPPGSSLLSLAAQTREEAIRGSIDAEPWDSLLRDLSLDALGTAAKRANLPSSAIVEFAAAKCRPANWEALFWYGEWLKGLAAADTVARDAVLAAYSIGQRENQRQQSSKAGKLSGEARRANWEALVTQRTQLLASGVQERDIAARLAKKHGITSRAVNAAFKKLGIKKQKRTG